MISLDCTHVQVWWFTYGLYGQVDVPIQSHLNCYAICSEITVKVEIGWTPPKKTLLEGESFFSCLQSNSSPPSQKMFWPSGMRIGLVGVGHLIIFCTLLPFFRSILFTLGSPAVQTSRPGTNLPAIRRTSADPTLHDLSALRPFV